MVLQKIIKKDEEAANNPEVQKLQAQLKEGEENAGAEEEQQPTEEPVDGDASDGVPQDLAGQKHEVGKKNPEIFLKDERITQLITKQIQELINVTTDLNKRLKAVEQGIEDTNVSVDKTKEQMKKYDEIIAKIDSRLEKFMGLYEIVTNKFNPFSDMNESGNAANAAAPAGSDNLPFKPEAGSPQPEQNINVVDEMDNTSQTTTVGTPGADGQPAADGQAAGSANPAVNVSFNQMGDAAHDALIQAINKNIHESFAHFEKKMSQYVDDSIQQTLHGKLSEIEKAIEEKEKDAPDADVLIQAVGEMMHDKVSALSKEMDEKVSQALGSFEAEVQSEVSGTVVDEIAQLKDAADDNIPQEKVDEVATQHLQQTQESLDKEIEAIFT